jgi:hypothetical protein
MSAPYHYMHRKLEKVLKAFLAQNCPTGVTVYTFLQVAGLGQSVKEPLVAIRCQTSTPSEPGVQLELALAAPSRAIIALIRIRTHAEDITSPKDPLTIIEEYADYHADLVGKVVDSFYQTGIVAKLNAIAQTEGVNINIEQIEQPDMADNPEDRSGVTDITFLIHCNPTA